jgi:phosphoribosylaminoimidazolecarboxamide formyltransferase/IMP cyclohydrolase
VIIAPDATEEAIAIVAAKKNLRLLAHRRPARSARRAWSCAASPAASSSRRATTRWSTTWTCGRDEARSRASGSSPTCAFAFRVAKHVKSNAIVYAKDGATVGIGAGQMSRVDSPHRRVQGREPRPGRRLPESRCPRLGRRLGRLLPLRRRASGRDRGRRDRRDPAGRLDARRRGDRAADEAGLAMVFTGMRHFRH